MALVVVTSNGSGTPTAVVNHAKFGLLGNYSRVVNAIKHLCLVGHVNAPTQRATLAVLKNYEAASSGAHFVILMRGNDSPVLKGLYVVSSSDSERGAVSRIAGSGPLVVSAIQVERFCKYDTGGKRFLVIETHSFDANVDGIVLPLRKLKAPG